MKPVDWRNAETLSPSDFACWSCCKEVGTNTGWKDNNDHHLVYICPRCGTPNYFIGKSQVHAPPPGEFVSHLPPAIERLYEEARKCLTVNAPTASTMACRKVLMNVAVEMGMSSADASNYLRCVNWMFDNHQLPLSWKGWVDYIRKKGNEANHEIPDISQEDATRLVVFLGTLLKSYYEAPNQLIPATD